MKIQPLLDALDLEEDAARPLSDDLRAQINELHTRLREAETHLEHLAITGRTITGLDAPTLAHVMSKRWATGSRKPGAWVVLADETHSLAELRPTDGLLGAWPRRSMSHAVMVLSQRPVNLPPCNHAEFRFGDANLAPPNDDCDGDSGVPA